MEQVLCPIYQVLYKINGSSDDHEVKIATNYKKRIPIILKEQIRENTGKKTGDINFNVVGFWYTGFNADKEGPIGCSLDELIIKIKTRRNNSVFHNNS